MGNAFNTVLFLILSWYHVSFVFGCLSVWNKLVKYESMEFVYVLEKRLGRQSKPCAMVEIYSKTIVSKIYEAFLSKNLCSKRENIANKKNDEMLIVCLFYLCGMGKIPMPWDKRYLVWLFSMIHIYLQWQELIGILSWVAWGGGTRLQGAWDFQLMICQAYISYLPSL